MDLTVRGRNIMGGLRPPLSIWNTCFKKCRRQGFGRISTSRFRENLDVKVSGEYQTDFFDIFLLFNLEKIFF